MGFGGDMAAKVIVQADRGCAPLAHRHFAISLIAQILTRRHRGVARAVGLHIQVIQQGLAPQRAHHAVTPPTRKRRYGRGQLRRLKSADFV